MLMPDQTVSSASTVLSGGNVNISGNNNFVSNGKVDSSPFSGEGEDGVYLMKWNELAYEPRRMYRGMVYAYFPQVVLGDDSVDWKQIQTWLRENYHLDIPNVKSITSEESQKDIPNSIATLLLTVDKAYQAAGLDDHRQFIKYWPITPDPNRNQRKFQWATMTLSYVSQKYDQRIFDLVKSDLQTGLKQ